MVGESNWYFSTTVFLLYRSQVEEIEKHSLKAVVETAVSEKHSEDVCAVGM